jgi:hypothetical protein
MRKPVRARWETGVPQSGDVQAKAAAKVIRFFSREAAELWRRHAGDVCASWFEVTGDDQDIVTALLKYADVQPAQPLIFHRCQKAMQAGWILQLIRWIPLGT